MKPPLVIRGQWGLGDNIFARPIIRAATERFNVWLETPWPELYEDLPILFLRAERQLRTQMRNVNRQDYNRWSKAPAASVLRLGYGSVELRRDSIFNTLERQAAAAGIELTNPVWDLPEFGPGPVVSDRPIALVRPVTVRKEWRNEARNPRPEYVAEIAEQLMSTHLVIVVADLKQGHEWLDGKLPPHHQTFLSGEFSVTALLALAKSADILIGGVGWIVPAAVALRRKAFIILGGHGGHNSPRVITDPRMNLSQIGFAVPKRFCICTKMSHRCDKSIPDLLDQWKQYRRRIDPNFSTDLLTAA